VEGIGRVSPKGTRVSERSDDSEEFDERSWPSVRDDERKGVGHPGADVDEMDS
jgi:hypothetical protein